MTSRQLRLVRAASASSVATWLAAVSHTIAGGAAPHPLLVLAVSVLLVPFAAALIGARASRLRVAATVLVSQCAFHLTFQLLGAPTGGGLVSGHHHGLLVLGTATAAPLPDAPMLLGHAVAAVGTVLLLWRGEAMVRAVAGWVQALLRRPVVLPRPLHEAPARGPLDLHRPVDTVVASSVSRRGPPALV
ncbi:hypothetical protein [Streptomyces sp. AC495_CC817]|uniref:hypothetical protein n=1 Tax=Streptomyces sp. AC495_CC817 TaxID=2823900 RepID=UPI001C26FAE7|nr:hypothetical protein [Streptomyces sp. AC495_CC817]